MDECIFCDLGRQGEHIIYSDKVCYVMLDKFPAERGHMLVVLKKHYADMLETPDSVVAGVFKVAKMFGIRSKEVLNADGMNIETNIGKIAGQFVMHFHVHVIPRYAKRGPRVFDRETELSEKEAKELRKMLKL